MSTSEIATPTTTRNPEPSWRRVLNGLWPLVFILLLLWWAAQIAQARAERQLEKAQQASQRELEKVRQEAEVRIREAEQKAALQVDQVIVAADEPTTPATNDRQSRTAFVYLGVCQEKWLRLYFSGDIPEDCNEEQQLNPGASIRALRGTKVRDAVPTRIGTEFVLGDETGQRLRRGDRVLLRRIVGLPPVSPRGPRMFWAEVEVAARGATAN